MLNNVRELLVELGYTNIAEYPKEYRTTPVYRESNNKTVLSVRKDSGRWIDYAAGLTGNIVDLVKLSLNLTSPEEATAWLKGKKIDVPRITAAPSEKISTPKIFDKSSLDRLVDNYSFWEEKRNLPAELLQRFGGGLAYQGKMAGRYVFPVFNGRDSLIGFAGRDIFDNPDRVKWKLLGNKQEWIYPAFLNYKVIKEDRIAILVESIGDCLALFNAGIEHVLVTFGIHVSPGIINFLIRSDVRCITIAFNNDETEGEEWGNKAAIKEQRRLVSYFDADQIEIALPDKKDFGIMTKEEILVWKTRNLCQLVA